MTTLVLVHGFMGGAAQWDPQHACLSDDVELVALDLPGFGDAADAPVIDTIEGFATWAVAELRRRGVERYALLGHSMGGMIVQEMARQDAARISHLILYATGAVGVLPGRFETIDRSRERAQIDGPEATARRIAATWFSNHDAAPAYAACADIAARATLPAILAGLDAMEKWDGTATLSDINTPTLVIWGDQDRTYLWEQIERLCHDLPQASLCVVPQCAHAVHLENAEVFNQTLRDFLGL